MAGKHSCHVVDLVGNGVHFYEGRHACAVYLNTYPELVPNFRRSIIIALVSDI